MYGSPWQFPYIPAGQHVYTSNQTVTVNWWNANLQFGRNQGIFNDITLEDTAHKKAPFKLFYSDTIPGTGYAIHIQNGSYLGYMNGQSLYQIISINNENLLVRYLFHEMADDQNPTSVYARYFTFIAEGNDVTGLSTTSLEKSELMLHPNPIRNQLHRPENAVAVTIYNQLGTRVYNGSDAIIQTDDLPAGVYAAHVTGRDGKTSVQKLVKE